MSKKKYYHIQTKERIHLDDGIPWYSPVEAQWVSRVFTRGWIACSQGYYPSPNIRVVDANTGEIVEKIQGNGSVHINKAEK